MCVWNTSIWVPTLWYVCTARATSGGTCPLWHQTAALLISLLQSVNPPPTSETAVFSAHGQPLNALRHLQDRAASRRTPRRPRHCAEDQPAHLPHTAAMHLLEAGVEVNVIRGWLGHADLTTTNRYAEISTKTKQAALRASEPPSTTGHAAPSQSGEATKPF